MPTRARGTCIATIGYGPASPVAGRARQKRAKQGDLDGLCGATKRSGEPCLREAGWGTDHPGSGRCKHHGGAVPNQKVAAAIEESKHLSQSLDLTPAQAIDGVLKLSAGQLAYITMKVASLDEDELFEKLESGQVVDNRWVRAQRRSMMDLAQFSKVAADMGVDERMAQLAEQHTAFIQELVEGVFSDVGLTKEQRAKVGPAMRKRLEASAIASVGRQKEAA